jgi:uncharacterized protein (TIGR03435 family)
MRTLHAAVCLLTLTGSRAIADEFEAASIKPHPTGCVSGPMTRSGIQENGALILIENMSLKAIIQMAYGVKDYQYSAPGWLSSVCFDISAKPPSGYTHQKLRPLLQALLTNRFALAVHHVSKDVPAYALVVEKGGSKLQEAAGPRGFFTARPGLIEGKRRSMSEITDVLARLLNRPVIDETGLKSVYDIKLEWIPDPTAPVSTDDAASDPGASLSTALHEQLGLKLQSRKVPVDAVIVDHVEKVPTEN